MTGRVSQLLVLQKLGCTSPCRCCEWTKKHIGRPVPGLVNFLLDSSPHVSLTPHAEYGADLGADQHQLHNTALLVASDARPVAAARRIVRPSYASPG